MSLTAVAALGTILAGVGVEKFWVTPAELRRVEYRLEQSIEDVRANRLDILVLRRNAYETQLLRIQGEISEYQKRGAPPPRWMLQLADQYRRDIESLGRKIEELSSGS